MPDELPSPESLGFQLRGKATMSEVQELARRRESNNCATAPLLIQRWYDGKELVRLVELVPPLEGARESKQADKIAKVVLRSLTDTV